VAWRSALDVIYLVSGLRAFIINGSAALGAPSSGASLAARGIKRINARARAMRV